jgi:hypothetical protein
MFGFGKRKAGPFTVTTGIPGRFHVLLLSGDAAASKVIAKSIVMMPESDMERTALIFEDDAHVGAIVTSDDPGPLRDRCVSLGFKVLTVSIPRRRPHDNSHLVATDLRVTGEYQELRRDWLGG